MQTTSHLPAYVEQGLCHLPRCRECGHLERRSQSAVGKNVGQWDIVARRLDLPTCRSYGPRIWVSGIIHAQGGDTMANLPNVDTAFTQAVQSKKLPGVVVAAATDKGALYEKAFGVRELGKPAPMTLDTVVWIASMTKAITATAAMQMIERGKLKLEQPAGELVAELASPQVLEGFDATGQPRLRPARRPMTVRHLLTHTAGFTYDIWCAIIGQYQT